MKNYIVLRNNRESGPYSLDELRSFGLIASDLVWVDGESTAWQYPAEINSLKSIAEEGIKKPFPFSEPVREDHKAFEQYDWERMATSAAYNDTTLVTADFPERTSVYSTRSTNGIKKQATVSLAPAFFGFVLLLIGVGFCAFVVKRMVDGFGDDYFATAEAKTIAEEVLSISNSHTAQSNLSGVVPPSLTAANKADTVQTKVVITKLLQPTPTKPLPQPDTSTDISQSTASTDSVVASPKEEGMQSEEQKEEPAPPVKTPPVLEVSANDYSVGLLGGISNLELSVSNPSSELIEKAVVEVEYLKRNGSTVRSQMVSVENISPGGSKKIVVPSSNRGVKIRYRVVSIQVDGKTTGRDTQVFSRKANQIHERANYFADVCVFTKHFHCMKQILVFGAGKSSTALIEYFLVNALAENWRLTVVDASLQTVKDKMGDSPHGTALSFDITDDEQRRAVIEKADIVISLMPPVLHILIAKDCIAARKNLLTASYVDEQIKSLENDIESAGLLFLCEMGLDPGIDHMTAKKMIDAIQSDGGEITSFHSHCGGLVAPESDDNPWHYKISWNPRNVVMAGKAGAIFKQNGEIKEMDYEELFAEKRYVPIPGHDILCWYPNRDSLSYIPVYGLEKTATFIRTTLRHADFIYGWKNLIDLKLTGEEKIYRTDGKTLMQFFKEHMELNGFGDWLQQKLHEQFDSTKGLLSELVNLVKLEEEAAKKGIDPVDEFMMVDDKGDLQNIDIDHLKISAAATLADRMHDANLTLKQLFFLGMDDEATMVDKGQCSAADVLQLALEKKLMLQPEDKDMVIMLHEIQYTKNDVAYKATGSFVLKGEDSKHTAMAQTVGLPLAIAAKLILDEKLTVKGLQIPVIREIYEPVLQELALHGIQFTEEATIQE